ncbi:MAG: metal-sensitive transcriptional regulator [Acidimicrobiales bacterium]
MGTPLQEHAAEVDTAPGYSETKTKQLAHLRRIEGQVRGLHRMVEDDTYCIDVLTQLASVTKSLQSLGLNLLDEHLRHCVRASITDADDHGDAKLDEAVAAIARLLRS